MDGAKQFMATKTKHENQQIQLRRKKEDGISVMKITCDCSRKSTTKASENIQL